MIEDRFQGFDQLADASAEQATIEANHFLTLAGARSARCPRNADRGSDVAGVV